MAYTPIFARNTLPSRSTISGTNPYENINTYVDTSRITAASNQAANALNPYIKGISDLANVSVNVGNAPDTSRATSINRISGLTSRGVTSGDVASVSAMRPENKYEQSLSQGLSRLDEYSRGESTVDRNIANLYLTRLDAAGAASSMAQAQRIASNPYLTTGAKQAAMQETARTNASERSKLAGELAVKAQERAYTATKDYSQMSLDASRYEEEKYKTDLGTAMENVTNSINGAIAIGNLESSDIQDKINVWQTQTKTMMDDLTRQTNALVASGQLTSDQAAMRLDGIKTEIQASQKNVENELYKAKAIVEYESTNENLAISRETLDLNRQKAASDEQFNYASLDFNKDKFASEFGLSVDQFKQGQYEFEKTYGLSLNEFNQRVNEFNKTFGLSVDEFNQKKYEYEKNYGLSVDELNQRKDEFSKTFGLSVEEFNQKKEEFSKTYGLSEAEFNQRKEEFKQTFGLSVDEFNQKKEEFSKTYNLSVDELDQRINEFDKTFGLSIDEFNQKSTEFEKTYGLSVAEHNTQVDQFDKTFGLSVDEFNQKKDEFNKTYELNKTESQLKAEQLEATLTSMQLENYKTWNGLATSSVLDYRTRTQGTSADNVDDALANQTIRTSLNNTWQNIPGNEGTTMSEDWARAYYQSIQTSSESAAQTTKNKINTLKSQWVDTGIIGEEAFNNFTSQMQMVSDFGGNIKMSADGNSVYMVGADGKPLTDSSGATYSWDVNTGTRSTITDTTTTTDINKFNEWKTNNLLSSDTEDYTDTEVYDAYNKLKTSGITPTRENIISTLKNTTTIVSPNGTTKVESAVPTKVYESITENLQDAGSHAGQLTTGTSLFDNKLSIDPTSLKNVINYETSTNNRNYTVDFDIADIPYNTRAYTRDGHNSTWYDVRDAMINNIGKVIQLNGKNIVSLGLKNYNEFKYYDVDSGKTTTRMIDDIMKDVNLSTKATI